MKHQASNKKHQSLFVFIIIMMAFLSFFAGMIVYRNNLHNQGIRVIKNLFVKDDVKHFYQTPDEYNLESIFHTENVSYPFTFVVYGHTREPTSIMKSIVVNKIIEENPNFVFNTGDMVYISDEQNWKIFDLIEGQIINNNISFYPVLGNHEYRVFGGEEYYNNPEDPLKPIINRFNFLDKRTWYSFTYGNSLFVVLDTNIDHTPGSAQYKWLLNTLSNKDTSNVFLFSHYPMQPKGSIRTYEKVIKDLLEDYEETGLKKPDVVFTSDYFDYSRYLDNNINYISTGGGGTTRNYSESNDAGNLYKNSGKVFHYTKIVVSENNMTFEMIKYDLSNQEWVVDDTFTISK